MNFICEQEIWLAAEQADVTDEFVSNILFYEYERLPA